MTTRSYSTTIPPRVKRIRMKLRLFPSRRLLLLSGAFPTLTRLCRPFRVDISHLSNPGSFHPFGIISPSSITNYFSLLTELSPSLLSPTTPPSKMRPPPCRVPTLRTTAESDLYSMSSIRAWCPKLRDNIQALTLR